MINTKQVDMGYEINGVLAFLTNNDIGILQTYIEKIKDGQCYVEIGTNYGGSAILATQCTDKPVYSVDIENKVPNNVSEKFIFINKPSVDAAKEFNKKIGLLFIDGNHFDAKKDFDAWEDKVSNGGYVLFHDYSKHDEWTVIKDCDEIMNNKNYKIIFKPTPEDRTSILVLQKI